MPTEPREDTPEPEIQVSVGPPKALHPAIEKSAGVAANLGSRLIRTILLIPEWFAKISWGRIKPGWYLAGLLGLYALFMTAQYLSVANTLGATQEKLSLLEKQIKADNARLTIPVQGAHLPDNDNNLPSAPREYRKGVSEGFVFTGIDSGIPVSYGMPVVAASDGEVIKLDVNFKEMTQPEYNKLLESIKNGASENDLTKLRGRQIWIKHSDGTITRYCHLSKINESISFAAPIKRGQIIGFVGNSGTLEGIRGSRGNARLLFEVWSRDGHFFGENLKPAEVRLNAGKLLK
jgi:murein DD-endopeptidase MepM/ murein hydrolase activator NlpD